MAHLAANEAPRPDMRPAPWSRDAGTAALFESIDTVQGLLADRGNALSRPGSDQAAALRQVSASPAGRTPLGRYVLLRYQAPSVSSETGIAAWHQELTRSDSLFAAHRLVLDLSGQLAREQAVEVFETSRSSLNDPPELFPYGIRIHRRAGNPGTADQYMARCRGSGNEPLRQACAKAH